MIRDRWLYAWGLGSIAAGGASLVVPLYVVALGAGPTALGLLSAVAAVAGAVGAFVWGRLVDRTGRWRGLGAASLGGIVLALATVPLVAGVPLVVVANGLLWLSFSAATPVFTMLTVRDAAATDRSQRIARLNRIHGYGWAGGLALGTVWTVLATRVLALPTLTSQRAFLGLCAVIGTAAVLAGARWLPAGERAGDRGKRTGERGRRAGDRGTRGERADDLENRPVVTSLFPFLPSQLYWRLRTVEPGRLVDRFTPTLVAYFVGVALFFGGFGVFFAPLPAYLTAAGYATELVFLLYVVAALGSAAAYGAAGELTARRDRRSLQAGALCVRGSALPAVALVGIAFTPTTGLLLVGVLFAVIGVAWAVIATAAVDFVTDLAPTRVRGEALGVYTALSALAGGVGSLAGGTLADWAGYVPTFALAGVVVVASAAVVGRPDRIASLVD